MRRSWQKSSPSSFLYFAGATIGSSVLSSKFYQTKALTMLPCKIMLTLHLFLYVLMRVSHFLVVPLTTKCPLSSLRSSPPVSGTQGRSVWDTVSLSWWIFPQTTPSMLLLFYFIRPEVILLLPPPAALRTRGNLIEYVPAQTFIIQPKKTPIWPHQMLTYEIGERISIR